MAGNNKDFPQTAHGGDEGTRKNPDQALIQGLSNRDDLMITGNAYGAGEMLLRSLENQAADKDSDK